jgi:hypothetical protein
MTKAINALKVAALKAESEGKSSIEFRDIPEMPGNCPLKLGQDEKLLLKILKEFKSLPAGDLYELYTKRARYPKGERSFRSYMRRLCLKGLVRALGDKRGRIYEAVKED